MATFTHLPSGKWRAQVRKGGVYKSMTFAKKRDAETWARQVESQVEQVVANGYQLPPEGYTLGHLIDDYGLECNMGGKTKQATHAMLHRKLGPILLRQLNSIHLRDFVDSRKKSGAGGVFVCWPD